MAFNDKFKFEIVKNIAVLSTDRNGWTKELNLVSFNDAPPKYDIRSWDPDHQKMGKGVSLSLEEMQEMLDALADIEI